MYAMSCLEIECVLSLEILVAQSSNHETLEALVQDKTDNLQFVSKNLSTCQDFQTFEY